MSELTLYMFDDAVARQWQPFALTRPIGELLLGAHTFRARAELLFGARCAGHLSAPHLGGFDEPYAAPVVGLTNISTDRPRLFLSSRSVPDWSVRLDTPDHAVTLAVGDDVIGHYAPAGSASPARDWFDKPYHARGVDSIQLGGRVLDRVWQLVPANAAQIHHDHAASRVGEGEPAGLRVEMVAHSPGSLRIGENVSIEPNVVFDFTNGPIALEDGVTIRAFTRIAGPAYIGSRSTLLGGSCDAVSIGPVCRIHGEIEESIVLGYANKAHDGFLGHACIGRWVNLGALTTNSDLKNNYGSIRMWTPHGDVDTGLTKLGCLLGDHVKTGIGTMINTGTVIGAGSNLFGDALPPKYVPPFSWGTGADAGVYEIERFLEVAKTVMQRRDVMLSDDMSGVLRAACRLARGPS